MHIINFKLLFKIIVIPLIFLLSNCSTGKVVQTSQTYETKEKKKSVIDKKSCSENSRITIAKETFIQFRHDINEVDEYRKVAADWCDKFSKIPIKGKLKCGRCCDSSYFCK